MASQTITSPLICLMYLLTFHIFLFIQGKRSRTSKPYKVCDISRSNRKGIVACSLDDLRGKVAAKFNITEDFDVVLEDDCTVIEDEEYFDTLDPNTLLMVLKGNERTQYGK